MINLAISILVVRAFAYCILAIVWFLMYREDTVPFWRQYRALAILSLSQAFVGVVALSIAPLVTG